VRGDNLSRGALRRLDGGRGAQREHPLEPAMHEVALANDLVEQILSSVAGRGVARVLEVDLDVGAQRLVVPEALRMAFEAAARGTVAEGARLEIQEVAARAVCGSCGSEFRPGIDCYLCPACGRADARIVEGNDIILQSLSCEAEES
jgi:hydrogenase nickel incorporation protein HypA/HybF